MSNVTSDIPLATGHDGSWSRQGPPPSRDVLREAKYGVGAREITPMESVAYKQDDAADNNMVKEEVNSSSDEDDDEDEEDDSEDSYPEEPGDDNLDDENQTHEKDIENNEEVGTNRLTDESKCLDATPVDDSNESADAEEQSDRQLKTDNPKIYEPEMLYRPAGDDKEQVQVPGGQQETQQQQTKGTHSSEQIPKSHQTLKMRLKLRAPIFQDPSEEEVVVHKPGKRKRGRPQVQIKKEPKKFLQISLGNQADRWQEVKNLAGGLKFHSQVAKLLLDCFDAMLDGSLQWSSGSADSDLKSKLCKIFADKKIALPNDSWLPVSKSKRKASVTLAPPMKVVYKDDSEEMDDTDNIDEFADHSTDEDYLPVKDIKRPAKRSQPKRRKQSTPRRVVVTAQNQEGESKKIKPLKVTLLRNYIKDEEKLSEVKEESGKNKKRRRRSSDVQAKSPPAQKPPPIPPEFATYPKVFKCRRCPAKSEDTYATLELLREHFDTHKLDSVLPKKKYAPNLPPLSPAGEEETEEEAIQRMAKVLICCPDCKKLFFPGRLIQHLRTAHVRVLCEECGGMFSRVAMWEHKKAHRFKAQGKKPYKCDKCNKEFLWQVSLRQHRELHSKERPFICSACGKSFKTLTKMKRHEIIHEAVKPYTCPHCRRCFTQRTNLKTHIRTHTGEKPYKCEYCAKTFTHKVSMKTHMKKEHGVDLWRDGPPHRVQEFDDVRCQMKRRKNPLTRSIQKPVIMPDTSKEEIPMGVAHEPIGKGVTQEDEELHQEGHRVFREETRDYHEQRSLLDESKRLMEEQRGGVREEHRLIEDGRVISEDQRVLDPRSQLVEESPHEMVEISISNRQHVKAREEPHVMDHHNSDHQMQNCISPTEPPCETIQVPIGDDAQQQQQPHDMHRSAHESLHYTPHYLPVSTDMSHIPQHMPSSNTSHNHSVSRYTSGQDGSSSRYPNMSAMHPDIRQGSLHHELQQGAAAMHHPVTHSRYPSWAPPQAGGPQGYIPGEMGPAILSELMKLGK